MAWLQNLAGHAENLLNKIDQNAATVLNDPNKVFGDDSDKLDTLSIPDTDRAFGRSKTSSSSLNRLVSRSPIAEILGYESNNLEQGQNTDTVFITVSEKQRPYTNGTAEDQLVFENSLRSSPSCSSIHNSSTANLEVEALQARIAELERSDQIREELACKKLQNLNHMYSELHNEHSNLQIEFQRTRELLSLAQQEKEQYMARAQRVLQEKERLIALKETSSSHEAEENILSNYSEELKKEVEFQQSKVTELTDKNKYLTDELQSLQMQQQVVQKKLHATIQNLEENLLKEKEVRALAEEDCLQKTKELHFKLGEILQIQETIKAKNEEIDQLKVALRQRNDANFSDEYEGRIKSLTQTLMLKQNNLETVTTERNALRFQLEKIEAEHRREVAQLKKDQVKVINMQDIHEERITVPNFMRVSPHDRGVTRRVKQTYSTLDSISVRTGIFLRRYPVARVFVFSYIVVLHMWVLLVLFWYVPSSR